MPVINSGDNKSASTTTTSGIALTPDGQRVIPSSVRADGTARREIRVRPGYSPPEDVEVYKNRTAVAWKARSDGGVPGAALADDDDGKKPGASNKSAKRRAAKLRAKEAEGNSQKGGKGQEKDGGKSKGKQQPDELAPENPGPEPSKDDREDPNIELSKEDKEKQAKAIRKKIRQASDLKSRLDSGEKLLPEQVEKLIKLDKLIQQLNELGVEG